VITAASRMVGCGQLTVETSRATAGVVHRENVDCIIADHIEDGVRKAMQAGTSHTVMLGRVELGIALDPIKACVGRAEKRLAES
jgi:hypothetical protein